MDLLHRRCAGLDVHKDTVVAGVRFTDRHCEASAASLETVTRHAERELQVRDGGVVHLRLGEDGRVLFVEKVSRTGTRGAECTADGFTSPEQSTRATPPFRWFVRVGQAFGPSPNAKRDLVLPPAGRIGSRDAQQHARSCSHALPHRGATCQTARRHHGCGAYNACRPAARRRISSSANQADAISAPNAGRRSGCPSVRWATVPLAAPEA